MLPSVSKRTTFADHLEFGKIGESQITRWLLARGYGVVAVYDIAGQEHKGPRIFWPGGDLVAPDILAIKGQEVRWIEAKRKSVFSWHRLTGRWVTGINFSHYQHYLRVAESTPWPLWLLFLHIESTPWIGDQRHKCPPECPTGLFGQPLDRLQRRINHMGPGADGRQMVYWAHNDLQQIATLEEIITVSEARP